MGSLLRSLDGVAQRRPRLALLALVALAGAVTILLLAQAQGPVILYQEF